jgi:hypothetical protein
MAINPNIFIYIYIYMQEGMMRVGLFSFLTIHMLLCLLKVSDVFGVNAFNIILFPFPCGFVDASKVATLLSGL